jgi:hypothetical protein
LIPAGLLAMVPVPVPAASTVSTAGFGIVSKLAVTCWLALSVSAQVALLPLQPPPVHPAKDELAPAVAASVTCVPLAKLALHAWPQLMPTGVLLIVPPPAPAV